MIGYALLLVTLSADKPAIEAEIPKEIRGYFERSDEYLDSQKTELKKKTSELAVRIKNAPVDERAELNQEKSAAEKTLRTLNVNTVRCPFPQDWEVGDIGSVKDGSVAAIIDKRTMAIRFAMKGKMDTIEPELGIVIKDVDVAISVKAIVERSNTSGYRAGKAISEDDLFRVVSTEPDPVMLKLGFEHGVSANEKVVAIERITRSDVMKWRAQYEKEKANAERLKEADKQK